MSRPFTTSRRVEFSHTDAAGIAHFSSLLLYMEQAEHELWRSLGTSVFPSPVPHASLDAARVPVEPAGPEKSHEAQGHHTPPVISWPRVHVESDFSGAVRFEEVIDIAVSVARLGSKSVTFAFQLSRGSTPIANGKITAACCDVSHGKMRSVEIPAAIRHQLQQFLSDPPSAG